MKKLVALAFAAASMMAGPAFLVTTPSFAQSGPCTDGTAPEAWLRPGGYCSFLGLGAGSLSDPAEECEDQPVVFMEDLLRFDSLLYAGPVQYGCDYNPCSRLIDYAPADMAKGDRLLVAQGCQQ